VRLVQVTIPTGRRDAVVRTLDDEGIDYVVTDETEDREVAAVATFPLPQAAVEPVLGRLQEVGIDERTVTVVVAAETVVSDRFDELEAEYAETADREEDRISRQELQTKAEELVSGAQTFVLMTVLSAVIATAGLLLDSAATVVGSMVIAPLIGPAMSAAIGTVVDDEALFRRGGGVLVAVAAATLFAVTLRSIGLVPPGLDPLELAEVSERLAPNVLVLAVAIGAGVAGIVSLMRGVSASLVGVMIAVALIPPAAAVGVGIAFVLPRLVIGAGVIVAVNLLSINLAALVVLWYEGYRPPEQWFREDRARSALLKRVAVLVVAIALLSVFLGGVTYDSYTATTTEAEIRDAVGAELSTLEGDATLIDIRIERTGTLPPLETERVVVTVGAEETASIDGLADTLADRIAAATGADPAVEVRLVTIDRAHASVRVSTVPLGEYPMPASGTWVGHAKSNLFVSSTPVCTQ